MDTQILGKSYGTIAFRQELCDGCGVCMTACARAKTGSESAERAGIKIVPSVDKSSFELALCRQCGDPRCTQYCPAGALAKNGETGVIAWDGEKCVDCLLCTVGCAYGGITYDAVAGHVTKCDLCDGEPACVDACPTGGLTYLEDPARIHRDVGELEDMFVAGLSACQGCNSELLIRHTARKLGPNTVIAAPPGCIAGMGTVGYNGKTGSKVPIFHPLLTNTASMLAGAKRYYNRIGRDVTMLALAGDGGVVDVGFQSLSGAAERGEQLLFICVDNEGYMNTGMQRSGSTSFGSWTSTTPVGEALRGKTQDAKNMPVIMMMHNCEYVATASLAFIQDFYDKLARAQAATRRGLAYIHVYSPCPTGWRIPPEQTIEVCRKGVETNFVPLWEFERGKTLRFTHPVDDPLPVDAYLSLSGKYRHLDAHQREHIQRAVEDNITFLKNLMFREGGKSDPAV